MCPFWKRKPTSQEVSETRAIATGLITVDEIRELRQLVGQIQYNSYDQDMWDRYQHLRGKADAAYEELQFLAKT